MKLKFGISPCPNDTFIFENLVNEKIKIEGIDFDFEFYDIEELNQKASESYFDIVKISFAHLKNVQKDYQLLKSGGAMGYGAGPLLVRKNSEQALENIADYEVAIPGKNTTANFLLKYFYPQLNESNKKIMLFSDIESWTLANENRLGLLIHEGRFTYKEKGLALVSDLGIMWQDSEGLPIPLGCIVARHSLGADLLKNIEAAITASISNYDNNNLPIISDFIKSHAQEMSTDVMMQHINLYVNDFSKDIGESGMMAVQKLLQHN